MPPKTAKPAAKKAGAKKSDPAAKPSAKRSASSASSASKPGAKTSPTAKPGAKRSGSPASSTASKPGAKRAASSTTAAKPGAKRSGSPASSTASKPGAKRAASSTTAAKPGAKRSGSPASSTASKPAATRAGTSRTAGPTASKTNTSGVAKPGAKPAPKTAGATTKPGGKGSLASRLGLLKGKKKRYDPVRLEWTMPWPESTASEEEDLPDPRYALTIPKPSASPRMGRKSLPSPPQHELRTVSDLQSACVEWCGVMERKVPLLVVKTFVKRWAELRCPAPDVAPQLVFYKTKCHPIKGESPQDRLDIAQVETHSEKNIFTLHGMSGPEPATWVVRVPTALLPMFQLQIARLLRDRAASLAASSPMSSPVGSPLASPLSDPISPLATSRASSVLSSIDSLRYATPPPAPAPSPPPKRSVDKKPGKRRRVKPRKAPKPPNPPDRNIAVARTVLAVSADVDMDLTHLAAKGGLACAEDAARERLLQIPPNVRKAARMRAGDATWEGWGWVERLRSARETQAILDSNI